MEDLASQLKSNSNSNTYKTNAANDFTSGITLNHHPNANSTLAPVGTPDFKVPITIARAMIEQRQRRNDTEEKIAAIVAARQLEARKDQELELARIILRHHEDEQIQKHLLSLHREREIFKQDPALLAMAVSAGEDASLRLEATSRLRSVIQRNQHNELALLRSTNARANEDEKLLRIPGSSRLTPLTGYESGLLPLPSQALPLSSSSLSSGNSSFLGNQAAVAERLHGRSNSQFNRTDFDNDRSRAILNSLYSSRSSQISSNQDISSLQKYYNDIAGNGNLNSMHANGLVPGTNLLPGARAGAGAEWLRSPSGGAIVNSSLVCIPHRQHGKHTLDGQDGIFGASKRLKTSEESLGGGNGTEPEGEQKRFNKHQCKQWTLKFHELLAFKERMGHCNVPHGYKDNLALAMWVKRQRHQYNLMVEKKTSTLTGERIKLLENIGFVWNCLETAWEQHFQDLRHFVMRTGHCAVPSTYKRNPRLASWVVTQRRQCKLLEDGKQSSMTSTRLEKLKRIGFPVTTKKTGSTKNLNR